MKITYAPNPLYTSVELDEFEKKEFWYKIKIDVLISKMGEADFDLSHHEWFNKAIRPQTIEEAIAKARKHLDFFYLEEGENGEKSGLDQRVDMLYEVYLVELAGPHCGDCICVACTCDKCQAESKLGIDTIPGLGKHPANKILAAFGRNNDKSIDEVIEILSTYVPPSKGPSWDIFSQEEFDKNLQRWEEENKHALEYMLKHRDTHFSKEQL